MSDDRAGLERARRVAQAMLARDRASQALAMRILDVRPGWARIVMQVREDMINGHGLCHGGIIFALADSAFAFACNSYNAKTVAAAASIDYLSAAREGDELTAEASEVWRSRRSGLYEITVVNQRGERIAIFRGRSHRLDGPVVEED